MLIKILIVPGCENGTFGVDCKQTCGHCSGTDACHSVTGVCPHSCEDGYIGSLCIEGLLHSYKTCIHRRHYFEKIT